MEEAEIKMSIAEGLGKPDPVKENIKLQLYIDDAHAILKALKVDLVFESYQMVNETRNSLMEEFVSELQETGLIA